MSSAVGAQSIPKVSPLAGKPAPKEMLIDVAQLEREYFDRKPDTSDANQMVSFGTSGHRGSPLHGVRSSTHLRGADRDVRQLRSQAEGKASAARREARMGVQPMRRSKMNVMEEIDANMAAHRKLERIAGRNAHQ